MTSRIFRSIFLAASLILVAGLALTMGILYRHFGSQLQKELENEAAYLSVAVENAGPGCLDDLPSQSERITLVDTDGTVLFDSMADVSEMENHGAREEITEAIQNGSGRATRRSGTLGEETFYYAQRLENGQVIRVSSTQYTLLTLLGSMIQPTLILLIVLVCLSGAVASRSAKRIVEPLNELDLDHPLQNDTYDEVAPLLGKISRQNKTIRKQLSEAKRQQQEFSIITDHMSEGLLIIDGQTELLSANSSALRLLGAAEAPQNQSVLTLNRSEPFREAVEAVLKGEHNAVTVQLGESYCQLIANPVLREGEVAGAVLLLVDVTEKMRLEDMRREFTANVSHELKTPLTSISGFAEIMRDGMVKPEDIKSFAGRIFDEAQRLTVLVGDIIKISQLDEGCIPYEKEEIDLYRLADEILGRLEEPARKAGVALHVQGDHVVLFSVKPILEEMIYNLCDNGVKYNSPGGTVTVTLSEDMSAVTLTVTDTGIGIPAAHQARVFERFYRVDKSHSKEIGGTGLGLSIVKHGAAYLGAEISLKSAPGAGSSFILRWPKKAEK